MEYKAKGAWGKKESTKKLNGDWHLMCKFRHEEDLFEGCFVPLIDRSIIKIGRRKKR
jgi:hypothetical protein